MICVPHDVVETIRASRDWPTSDLDISRDVPKSTQATDPATETVTIPADGVLRDMLVAWPGVDGAVGVRVERFGDKDDAETDVFLPRNVGDEYSTTKEYTAKIRTLNQPVSRSEVIEASYVNTDDTRNHLVTVLISYAQKPQGVRF